MTYGELSKRLQIFGSNISFFQWPIMSKDCIDHEINYPFQSHIGVVRRMKEMADAQDAADNVKEYEQKAVYDVLYAICFVINCECDCLRMLSDEERKLTDMFEDPYRNQRYRPSAQYRHTFPSRIARTFPSWLAYVDNPGLKEGFEFIFYAFTKARGLNTPYNDAALVPYFKNKIKILCRETSQTENPFMMEEPVAELPASLLIRQVRNLMESENQLKSKLKESDDDYRKAIRELGKVRHELNMMHISFGTPYREYIVDVQGSPFKHRVSVYEELGKIVRFVDLETIAREVIIDKLGVEPGAVTYQSDLVNDLGADSLDSVELIMELERLCGVCIPDEEVSDIRTFQDVITTLFKKVDVETEVLDIDMLEEVLGDSYQLISLPTAVSEH